MGTGERIVVGISGGVDSAVAALRLLRAGYDVHGLHMTNWEEEDAYCSAAADYQSARQVCQDLGIPLHRANFSATYREQVFAGFLRDYQAGRTPNPDVLCNRHIKFGAFLDYAWRLGAEKIATGHYAQLDLATGPRLLMGADPDKDQTYFLHAVAPEALTRTVFPIGDLLKSQVRDLANKAGLGNHARPDSTGICFIGERPFRDFLKGYLAGTPGPIMTVQGECVGEHEGLMFYTLGQRSGIGIGGLAGGSQEPWYVVGKDAGRNILVVAQGRNDPRLWADRAVTSAARWINGRAPELLRNGPLTCQVRIRHRHAPAASTVVARPDGGLEIRFREAQWAVTPGQFAVLYLQRECLGGAAIHLAFGDIEHAQAPAAALR